MTTFDPNKFLAAIDDRIADSSGVGGKPDTEGTIYEFDEYLEKQGLHQRGNGHLLATPRAFNDVMDHQDAIKQWAEFLDSISLKEQWTLVIAQTRKRFDQARAKVRELLDL